MPKKQGKSAQRVKTYLSKKDLARFDAVCEQLKQSRYRFMKTALLNAISFMEQWFNGELTPIPFLGMTPPTILRTIDPNPNSQETEAERQKHIAERRKQALALANPHYAKALTSSDHQALQKELVGAFKEIGRLQKRDEES